MIRRIWLEKEIDITVEQESQDENVPRDDETAAQCESDQYLDQLQRLQAEFENYRKRIQRREEQMTDEIRSEVCKQLLPVVDDMERALAHAGEEEALRSGLEMIYDSFISILTTMGLEVIEATGRPFDPRIHEAVMVEVDPQAQGETVTEELQKGYLFQEKLLRPAKVKVTTGSSS
jgi:molecular chaperone GrpE